MNNNIPESYTTEYEFQNTITEREEESPSKAVGNKIRRCKNSLCRKIFHDTGREFGKNERRIGDFCDDICYDEYNSFNARMKEVKPIKLRFM